MNRTCNTITLLAVAGLAFAAGRADIFSDSSAIAEQPQDKGILKDVKEGVKSAGKAITDTANKVVEDEQPAADDAMAAMMKAGTPGEHHKYLDATIGEWDTVVRFAPPLVISQAELDGALEAIGTVFACLPVPRAGAAAPDRLRA